MDILRRSAALMRPTAKGLMYFSGFLNERLIFYELFCEGSSALHKYALKAMRGLSRNHICDRLWENRPLRAQLQNRVIGIQG